MEGRPFLFGSDCDDMSATLQLMLAALSGGILTALIRSVVEYAGLKGGEREAFRDDLISRVNKLQKRINKLESDLQKERRARLRAELRNETLARRIKALVEELNRLRENQDMEPLDAEDFQVDSPLMTPKTDD
jgi:outer membrane murein-binding lipoprotein Lpp